MNAPFRPLDARDVDAENSLDLRLHWIKHLASSAFAMVEADRAAANDPLAGNLLALLHMIEQFADEAQDSRRELHGA